MQRKRFDGRYGLIVLPVLIVGLLIVSLLYGSHINKAEASAAFETRPLTGMLPDEVGQYAVGYTQRTFTIISGTPEVRVSRPVTLKELPSLNLPQINLANGAPPLMLVALHGNFDLSGGKKPMGAPKDGASDAPRPAEYIVYVFDTLAGEPVLIQSAPMGKGGRWKILLNDPSLPDDGQPEIPVGTPPPSLAPIPPLPSAPGKNNSFGTDGTPGPNPDIKQP